MTEYLGIHAASDSMSLVVGDFPAARAILESAISNRAFPGAAFGVLHQGRFFTGAVGNFTYASTSPAVQPETVYDLASVTKVVATTAMAMVLHQRGLLDLERPVAELLPALALDEPASPLKSSRSIVTFSMLLAHCSGLPAYARLFENHRTPQSLINACLAMPLEAPPLSRALYSDIGFILLGLALEQLAGESLRSFTHREIFSPLGMHHTDYLPPVAWQPTIPPTVNDTSFRHRIVQGRVHDENCSVLGGVSGHAGLFSNVGDLLRFANAMLTQRSLRGGSRLILFEPQTVRLFTTRWSAPAGTSRALGWDTPSAPSSSGRYFSPRSAGHLGYTGTSLWIDFHRSLAIVLLTNRTWPANNSQSIRSVRPAFHDAIIEQLEPGLT